MGFLGSSSKIKEEGYAMIWDREKPNDIHMLFKPKDFNLSGSYNSDSTVEESSRENSGNKTSNISRREEGKSIEIIKNMK